MGTRSLTRVIEDDEHIICMYRQYDGYPSGHGFELAEFLLGMSMVNGIACGGEPKRIANGGGCLAAQLVAHFKEEPGGIYLYPTKTKDANQEYEYEILTKFNQPQIEIVCYEVDISYPRGWDHAGRVKRKELFRGNATELLSFCKHEGKVAA